MWHMHLFTAATLFACGSALQPPRTIVVAGATGRVGRLVVERLLRDDATHVLCVVRNATKAAAVLPAARGGCVTVVVADLEDAESLGRACAGSDGAIWCATGFARTEADAWNPLRAKTARLVDEIALPAMAAAIPGGRVVMLSSAGVTRPSWSKSRRARHAGAYDIPIIRLNPGGVLGRKRKAEKKLARATADFAVVRPTGLNDDWAPGRPLLTQGDVAVGRACPSDVADVLVASLDSKEARGKVFEMVTLAGYPPPESLDGALAALTVGRPRSSQVDAAYGLLQQLLPGEKQDATKLEMGRTYEEVDAGEVDRAPGAAPSARERATADAAEAMLKK